jgi:hypothetical protein
MELQEPTQELVARYVEEFNTDELYYPADLAIGNLLQKFPSNALVQDVMLKVSAINALYSTRIMNVSGMAYHIAKLNIDPRLASGDLSLVEAVATGHGIGRGAGGSRFFSFATKYCNWHRQDIYPIYDTFVGKILIAFRKKYAFSNFKDEELKNCVSLKRIIIELQKTYSLDQYNLKAIDKFLWRYGQDVFPVEY